MRQNCAETIPSRHAREVCPSRTSLVKRMGRLVVAAQEPSTRLLTWTQSSHGGSVNA